MTNLINIFVFLTVLVSFCMGQSETPSVEYGPPGFTPGVPLDLGGYTYAPCKNTNTTRNKRLVSHFYQNVIGGKQLDIVPQVMAENYLNHNPSSKAPGRDDFLKLFEGDGPFANVPPQKVDLLRVDAVDDIVWLHAKFGTLVAMDIFKIDCDGLISEHWDVVQDITKVTTTNPVAFF